MASRSGSSGTKAEGRLFVLVHDGRQGASFELDVDSATALDAFDHPYAYAAHRGVEYSVPRRRDETLSPRPEAEIRRARLARCRSRDARTRIVLAGGTGPGAPLGCEPGATSAPTTARRDDPPGGPRLALRGARRRMGRSRVAARGHRRPRRSLPPAGRRRRRVRQGAGRPSGAVRALPLRRTGPWLRWRFWRRSPSTPGAA